MTTHIPTGPNGGFLNLGNVREFNDDPLTFSMQAAQYSEDLVCIKFGPQIDLHLLINPDYVREVLVKQWQKTVKWERYQAISQKSGPQQLALLEGEPWKKRRQLVTPAFHTQRIKAYAELMGRHTLQRINTWQDGAVYDMQREMTTITMGIIGEILFDLPDIERDAAELSQALNTLLAAFMRKSMAAAPVPAWVPTAHNRAEREAVEVARGYLGHIVAERRAEGRDHGDVLSALLNAVDAETGEQLADAEIIDELYGQFVAGHETTATLMTWAWYLLAQHEDIQTALYDEAAAVISAAAPTLEDLKALPFTGRVLQEALRIYPPAWSLFVRLAVDPIELGDYTIPAGGLILINPYVLHHDSRWWPEPEKFNPARFEGDWKAHIPAYAYMPFGGGPRVCIGSHMAEMEAAIMLSTIVKQFAIGLQSPDQTVEKSIHFTLVPAGGMPLRVIKR